MPDDYKNLLQGGDPKGPKGFDRIKGFNLNPFTRETVFSPDNFAKWYENYQNLGKSSLEEAGKIIADQEDLFRGIEASEAEEGKNRYSKILERDLLIFSRSESKNLADLVWKSDQKTLLGYVLGTRAYEGTDPKYEETRKSFEGTKKELDEIRGDEQKYVAGKMKGFDDLTRSFFEPFIPKMVHEEQIILQDRTIITIGEYGFPEFVSQNIEAGWKKVEAGDKDAEKVVPSMTATLANMAYKAHVSKKAAEEKAKAPEEESEEE